MSIETVNFSNLNNKTQFDGYKFTTFNGYECYIENVPLYIKLNDYIVDKNLLNSIRHKYKNSNKLKTSRRFTLVDITLIPEINKEHNINIDVNKTIISKNNKSFLKIINKFYTKLSKYSEYIVEENKIYKKINKIKGKIDYDNLINNFDISLSI